MRRYKPDPASTTRGIVFGSAIIQSRRDYSRDEVTIQAALLNTASDTPPPILARVLRRVSRFFLSS